MGLLDRLLGERHAKAIQDVYDRTATAANQGLGAVQRGLSDLEAARLQTIAENEAKAKAGDMWYQKAGQGISQFMDDAQAKAAQFEAYRQENLRKQGRQDPLQGIRSFFS